MPATEGLGILIVSTIIFLWFTYALLREYDVKGAVRKEFGYRIWTLGFLLELIVYLNVLGGAK